MKKIFCALLITVTHTINASEYGCKVLLCLSNPNSNGGPKAHAECIAQIDQLYHDLRNGHPFPTCDQTDGNDGTSYARLVYDPYDLCPSSLKPAPLNSYVVQGGDRAVAIKGNTLYVHSDTPRISGKQNEDRSWSERACVAIPLGSYIEGSGDSAYEVHIFNHVVWQKPQSPHAIDVFLNNKWYQRVRWE